MVRTLSERQAKADQVPPSMVNDPAPIRDLADRLGDLVNAVAKSPKFDLVPESFRGQWKLTPDSFDDIREASDTPERHEDLKRRIGKAFEPLIRDGVLGPDILPRDEETSRTLSVHMVGRPPSEPRLVSRDRVMSERLDKPDGPVGKDFIASFNPPALGESLFSLIAGRLAGRPTLSFEEAYTNNLREQARNSVEDVYEPYTKGEQIVEQGKEIQEEQLLLLRAEHEAANAQRTWGQRLRRAGSVLVSRPPCSP